MKTSHPTTRGASYGAYRNFKYPEIEYFDEKDKIEILTYDYCTYGQNISFNIKYDKKFYNNIYHIYFILSNLIEIKDIVILIIEIICHLYNNYYKLNFIKNYNQTTEIFTKNDMSLIGNFNFRMGLDYIVNEYKYLEIFYNNSLYEIDKLFSLESHKNNNLFSFLDYIYINKNKNNIRRTIESVLFTSLLLTFITVEMYIIIDDNLLNNGINNLILKGRGANKLIEIQKICQKIKGYEYVLCDEDKYSFKIYNKTKNIYIKII